MDKIPYDLTLKEINAHIQQIMVDQREFDKNFQQVLKAQRKGMKLPNKTLDMYKEIYQGMKPEQSKNLRLSMESEYTLKKPFGSKTPNNGDRNNVIAVNHK